MSAFMISVLRAMCFIRHICLKEYMHYGRMANDICVRFGRRLQRLRKEKGMKQIDLAVDTGLGRTYISKVENGRIEPCLRSLELMAVSFGMSLSQLFKEV